MSLIREIAKAVRDRFNSEVATPRGLTVVHDNAPVGAQTVEPGDTPTPVPDASTPWCRFTVLLGRQEQQSIAVTGSRRFRTTGVAMAQVFTPLNRGDGAQLALISDIQDAFRGVTLPGPPYITFRAPFVSAGPVRDGAHMLRVVTIEFLADEFA